MPTVVPLGCVQETKGLHPVKVESIIDIATTNNDKM